ncbi:MAG: uncharacterized protein JWM74_4202 [Myxococcaceae bacterium]|nr:uncharacterized protein [Myxococcaceae bacterium]
MKRSRVAAIVALLAGATGIACNVLLGNEDGVFVRDGVIDAATTTPDGTTTSDGEVESDGGTIVDAPFENRECDARPNDDPKNCGSCGHDCLGGDCRTGKCLPVVMTEDAGAALSQRMAMSDEGIYIIGGGTLHRVGLDGGGASTLYTPAASSVLSDLAASPTKIVFAQSFGSAPSIRSCPLGACPDAAVESTSIVNPHALSLVGERPFWGDLSSMYASTSDPLAPEVFQAEDITATVGSPTRIYWGRTNDSTLRSALPDGGDVATLALDSGSIVQFAVRPDVLVWVASGALYTATPDGGSPRRLALLSGGTARVGLAGDDIYWLESTTGVLRRCSVAGSCAGEVVSLKPTADFAITQRAIWWVEQGGRLLRLAR